MNFKIIDWITIVGTMFGIWGVGLGYYVWYNPIAEVQSKQVEISSDINKIDTNFDELRSQVSSLSYDFPRVFNDQKINTELMTGDEVLRLFYESLRLEDYETACSLLSTRICSLYDYAQATDWINKTKNRLTVQYYDGEKLNKVWNSGKTLENTGSELWCGQIKYRLNTDKEDITHVNQYTISTRPDGKKEIRRTLCEGASKNGRPAVTRECYVDAPDCIPTEPVTP